MFAVVNFALRGLQVSAPPTANFARSQLFIANTFRAKIFFAIVILGLSGHLVASQAYGGAPSVTNYEVFLGIWLIVVSILGLVATKIEALAGPIGVGLEALTILFTFAGGTVCDESLESVLTSDNCGANDNALYDRLWLLN